MGYEDVASMARRIYGGRTSGARSRMTSASCQARGFSRFPGPRWASIRGGLRGGIRARSSSSVTDSRDSRTGLLPLFARPHFATGWAHAITFDFGERNRRRSRVFTQAEGRAGQHIFAGAGGSRAHRGLRRRKEDDQWKNSACVGHSRGGAWRFCSPQRKARTWSSLRTWAAIYAIRIGGRLKRR